MSTLNIVHEEHYESDDSANPIRHSISDEMHPSNDNWKRIMHKIEKGLPYLFTKSLLEIVTIVFILVYFLIIHYIETNNNPGALLYPIVSFWFIHLFLIITPKVFSRGIQEFCESLSLTITCLIEVIVIALSLYEAIENVANHVYIIIGFGRCFRIILFYILTQTFYTLLIHKCKKSSRFEIDMINRVSNLESLLNEVLIKNQSKDEIVHVGISRALLLAKKMKKQSRPRNQLPVGSILNEVAEIEEPWEKKFDFNQIDSKIKEVQFRNESYFKEAFDFISMEQEYSIKLTLDNIRELEFDIFDLEQKSNGNELFITLMHLMQKESYLDDLKISQKKLRNFAYVIQNEYNNVMYHNKTHASDVCQTSYYFMFTWDFIKVGSLDRVEQAWMLLSGAVHDIDHPGYNNIFMINTKSPLAIRYNDMAVLESYHVATAFRIMVEHSDWFIFDNLNKDEYNKVRKIIVGLVLATDMARHFPDMGRFKGRVESPNFDAKGEDK